jgi:hypothetical protein
MTESIRDESNRSRPLVLRVGRDELLVRRRYEVASIINDLLIGLWFAVGSILFFSPATSRAGTWLFLVGSLQLLIRPLIRLTRTLHLRRVGTTPGSDLVGTGPEF